MWNAFRRLALLGAVSAAVAASPDEPAGLIVSESPDGRLGLLANYREDGVVEGVKIVRLPSREPLADLSEIFFNGVTAAWSGDSSKVAVNGRAGGRYETSVVYAIDAAGATELPSPEEVTGEAVDAAMAKVRKELEVPANAYQRRIWDKWEVRRWLDDSTAEVFAHSTRVDYPRDEEGGPTDEEGYEINANLRFKLRLKEGRAWEILETAEVAQSEILGD